MSLAELLSEVLHRPGGDPGLRALALIHGAAVVGRFDAVAALLPQARALKLPESELAEAALQVVAYGGFPRAIQTLQLLALDRHGSADGPPVGPVQAAAGQQTWDAVYAEHAGRVLSGLHALHPGFHELVLAQAYGSLLARPGLDLGRRELLGVAALALMALPRPLESHVRGALHNGFAASAVQDILLTSHALADDHARTVIDEAAARLSRKAPPR